MECGRRFFLGTGFRAAGRFRFFPVLFTILARVLPLGEGITDESF